MHDHDAKNAARHSEPGEPAEQNPPASRRRWLRRLFGRRAALIGLPVLVGGGLLAGQALAGRGFAFGHGCRHHAMSDEQLVEHVNARLDFVLDRLDANEEQKAAIRTRLRLLEPELLAARKEHRALKDEFHRELAKDRVDPARIEQLRARLVTAGDRVSKAITDAVVDVSDVLTLEQRQKILEHLHGGR